MACYQEFERVIKPLLVEAAALKWEAAAPKPEAGEEG